MTDLICASCKQKVVNKIGTTRFKCPNCSKYEIVRCKHCREIAARYVCAECEFSGPN